jgi:isocitrate/isopropylmalate dehydrogenase
MLLTTRMMLEWLGETESAVKLEKAIADVISEGKVRTYDMGGSSSTLDVARAVADKM